MSAVHELVTIFTGQAGTQISNACWELFCYENGIQASGHFRYPPLDNTYCALFALSQTGKLVPYTVIVDSEPTVIDEIRSGVYRHLFDPRSLITGKEDAASNFAKGYFTVGREMIDKTLDRIRVVCENCSNFSGFMVFRSCGGGTGSGFTTLLLENLYEDYKKKLRMDFLIQTSEMPTEVVEPYNSILTTYGTMDCEDCCFMADNEALYDIYARKLHVENATYTNVNRLLAQVVSGITSPMRTMPIEHPQGLVTNLVPYERLHFLIMSYAPLISPSQAAYAQRIGVKDITYDSFVFDNQLIKCDPTKGSYLGCRLIFRGGADPTLINDRINSMMKNRMARFVQWGPKSSSMRKVWINSRPVTTIPGGDLACTEWDVVGLGNNTVIGTIWTNIRSKFDLLREKRAFLHHYLAEGMEEDTFKEARANVAMLEDDYMKFDYKN